VPAGVAPRACAPWHASCSHVLQADRRSG
jgi:hypothetical protein